MRVDGSSPQPERSDGIDANAIGALHQRVLETRASRLGVALSGMAQELAAAHRQLARLRRENAALRAEVEELR